MEQFKIKPLTKAQILGQLSLKLLPLILFFTAGIALVRLFHIDGNTLFIGLVVTCSIAVVAGYIIGWGRIKTLYKSYTLTISGNAVIREQYDLPTVVLSFTEINEIAKHPDGSYTIKGKHQHEVIGIPEYIDNRLLLERSLNEIRPMVAKAS